MKHKDFTNDFEEFYLGNKNLKAVPYTEFLKLPLDYTYSIYMDFFSTHCIHIQLRQVKDNYYRVGLVWNGNDLLGNGIIKESFDEARNGGFLIAKDYYSRLLKWDDFPICEY